MENLATPSSPIVVILTGVGIKERKEFVNWYNKQYGVHFSGNSGSYLIPHIPLKSTGKRCDRYYPKAPRISFYSWKQQYCTEHYEIY